MPEGAFYIMMNIEKLIGRTIGGVEITDDDVFAEAFPEAGPGGRCAVLRLRHKELRPLDLRHHAWTISGRGLNRLEKFLAE